GGFVVDDVADGRGKAVHDLVAEVGGAGGDVGIIAQAGGHGGTAHAGRNDGVRRAVDRVGQPVHQIVAQVVEDAQVLEVLQGDPHIVHIGEVLAEAPGDDQVGADVADDGDAEIEH